MLGEQEAYVREGRWRFEQAVLLFFMRRYLLMAVRGGIVKKRSDGGEKNRCFFCEVFGIR
jgi:hypothetical protein